LPTWFKPKRKEYRAQITNNSVQCSTTKHDSDADKYTILKLADD